MREPDGLAMSSRNAQLSADDRDRALALHRALLAAEQAVADGVRDPAAVSARALSELNRADLEPDYLALVSPDTLKPVQDIEGEVLALVAARVGTTRLIDNHRLSTPFTAGSQETNGRPSAAHDPDDLDHYDPRVVHVGAHNEILTVDSEVATLLAAPTPA